VELSVGGMLYYFKEPDSVLVSDSQVDLVYGSDGEDEGEDDLVFANLHATTGGYIDKALKDTDCGRAQKVRFHIIG